MKEMLSLRDEQTSLEAAVRMDLANQPAPAADLYQQIVQNSRMSASVRAKAAYHLGICRSRLSQWAKALEALEIAAYQSHDEKLRRIALLDLAEVLMKSGTPKAAVPCFEQLLARGIPGSISLLHVRLRMAACQLAAGEKPLPVELPPAGEIIHEETAGAWFEAAYAFEVSSDLATAFDWYRLLLDRTKLPAALAVNARFRCGYVSEARLDWNTSLACYEQCVESPRVYPLAQDLARLHLANLLYASEEYDRAAAHYAVLKLADSLTPGQQAQARLRHARCLICEGCTEEGEKELVQCRRQYTDSDVSVQAELLLADIYGGRADHRAAEDCYRRVIDHPCAEPSVKTLAQMCLLQLPRL
jgi:tetratricopeptide (TPR) repeat protein